MTQKRSFLIILALTLIAGGIASWQLFRESAEPEHRGHGPQHPQSTADLQPAPGRKWQPDASFRLGMERIQTAIADNAESAAHDHSTAVALSTAVRREIDFMVANCKLTPEADAAAHVLLLEMIEGADLMTRRGQTSHGIGKVRHALAQYPQLFDHPHWAK